MGVRELFNGGEEVRVCVCVFLMFLEGVYLSAMVGEDIGKFLRLVVRPF